MLLGVEAYQALLDELGLFRDLRVAEEQADRQSVQPRELAESRLHAMLGR